VDGIFFSQILCYTKRIRDCNPSHAYIKNAHFSASRLIQKNPLSIPLIIGQLNGMYELYGPLKVDRPIGGVPLKFCSHPQITPDDDVKAPD
jgi:hypothetical protein